MNGSLWSPNPGSLIAASKLSSSSSHSRAAPAGAHRARPPSARRAGWRARAASGRSPARPGSAAGRDRSSPPRSGAPRRAREAADHVEDRIDLDAGGVVEPGLGVRQPGVGDAELACGRCHGRRLEAAARDLAEVAEMPGGAEQPTVARLDSGHGDALVVRVRRVVGAVGIEAVADVGGSDAVGRVADESPGRADDVRDRFEVLHDRAVVAGMDQGRGRVRHEIEQLRAAGACG